MNRFAFTLAGKAIVLRLFFLVDGYDYKPYAVFKTRQFEQECMECEGIDDGD